jgi:hypothetical protein
MVEMAATKFDKKGNVIASTECAFITTLKITQKNVISMCENGRRRWKIENEGFNIQKNKMDLIHRFSMNYQAMKCHYCLIQIAHTLCQLFWKGCELLKMIKKSLNDIHIIYIHEHLKSGKLTAEKLEAAKSAKFQARLPGKPPKDEDAVPKIPKCLKNASASQK